MIKITANETAAAKCRHQQSSCPLTPEIPLSLHRDLRGHRVRLLTVLNRTPDKAFEDGFRVAMANVEKPGANAVTYP